MTCRNGYVIHTFDTYNTVGTGEAGWRSRA